MRRRNKYLVMSINSLMAAPPGPIMDPEMALETRNFIEIRFLTGYTILCISRCWPRGEEPLDDDLGEDTLLMFDLALRATLSLLFLELLLALLFSFLAAVLLVVIMIDSRDMLRKSSMMAWVLLKRGGMGNIRWSSENWPIEGWMQIFRVNVFEGGFSLWLQSYFRVARRWWDERWMNLTVKDRCIAAVGRMYVCPSPTYDHLHFNIKGWQSFQSSILKSLDWNLENWTYLARVSYTGGTVYWQNREPRKVSQLWSWFPRFFGHLHPLCPPANKNLVSGREQTRKRKLKTENTESHTEVPLFSEHNLKIW